MALDLLETLQTNTKLSYYWQHGRLRDCQKERFNTSSLVAWVVDRRVVSVVFVNVICKVEEAILEHRSLLLGINRQK